MPLKLMSLPYAPDALEPTMSAETLKTHHGKHHAKYVNTVNELIKGTKYEEMPLDELVRAAHDDGDTKLFNNAAQVWNHDLFLAIDDSELRQAPEGSIGCDRRVPSVR